MGQKEKPGTGSCEEIDFWEKTSGYFGKFCD
jgi:hypothetical protein